MMNRSSAKPSFSRLRKWGIGFNVVLAVLIVCSVTVMVNYLSGRYAKRFHLSTQTSIALSPRTISVVRSLTNNLRITLYYSKVDSMQDESLYNTLADLIKEYCEANTRITAEFVDYVREPALAEKIKSKYNLQSTDDKDLVIFDCEGKPTQIVSATELTLNELNQVPSDDPRYPIKFNRKPIAFKGEMIFTSKILALTNPKPFKAYIVQYHHEHNPTDGGNWGYSKFAEVLQETYIKVAALSLTGAKEIPDDCNLLIIPGPEDPFPDSELDMIDQYLREGGRLLVLLNYKSRERPIGLETLLAKWGIEVTTNIVQDLNATTDKNNPVDLIVFNFGKHQAVNALHGSQLLLLLPRELRKLDGSAAASEGVTVDELVFSGFPGKAGARPVMVAAEKPGVITDRGSTRIIVAGDSTFLCNVRIDVLGNRSFVGLVANWLLDRDELIKGLEPQKLHEYRLVMTENQMHAANWVLLAGMPGAILLFGGLVWLRRRR